MSIWLQKRLAIWVGAMILGGALLWNGGTLRAQVYKDYATYIREGKKPRQKLTKAQATKAFVSAMNMWPPKGDGVVVSFSPLPSYISLKSQRELRFHGNVDELFRVIVRQWKKPFSNRKKANRPLVLTQDNGGWGVDLVETYALWNNFDVAARAEAIYGLTGVVLEGLPSTEPRNQEWCQTKMQGIALGLAQYVQDYDEKLPPAKQWIDGSVPYVKSGQIFNCTSVPKTTRWGYAFNTNYSTKFYDRQWESSPQSVLLYETSILKRNAYGIGENAAFRHQNGANYAFADGHVKWFPKGQTPSFKLKP